MLRDKKKVSYYMPISTILEKTKRLCVCVFFLLFLPLLCSPRSVNSILADHAPTLEDLSKRCSLSSWPPPPPLYISTRAGVHTLLLHGEASGRTRVRGGEFSIPTTAPAATLAFFVPFLPPLFSSFLYL